MDAIKVTKENIEEIHDLYRNFINVATEDFFFERPPLPFNDFKSNFEEGFVKIYLCKSTIPEGFLLYSDNLTQGLEITLIYTQNPDNDLETKNTLIKQFIEDAKAAYKNKVISYPMLGIQNNFTQDITNLGFTPVGEMISEFNFSNTVSQVIFTKSQVPLPKDQYNIDTWNDIYFDDAAKTIYEEFSHQNDAKFDERFTTLDGSKEVLECIVKGYYGDFLPKVTTVLKYGPTPIGYCFTNLTTPEIANIPLLVISKEHHGKNFGSLLLKKSVQNLKNSIDNNEISARVINTTCDTSNFAAIKTYRKIGFKEKTYYTHAYLKI